MTGAYGRVLGAHLHLDHVPALTARTIDKAPVAITRVWLDWPAHGPTSPIPPEDAYMIVLQTGQPSRRELWLDGRPVRTEPLNPGEVALHDLRRQPTFKMYTPIDSVNFYIPRHSLDACADDAEAPRIEDLVFTPGIGVSDRILAAMGAAILPVFEDRDQVNQLFIDHFTSAVVVHIARAFGGMHVKQGPPRGALAPWHERRVKELLDANLAGDLTLSMLAGACDLSTRHFTRAFRQSVGLSPHQWLLQRRVDKARELLRDPRLSLAEVAIACGFANQSHFTRVFTRLASITPGRWRRVYRE